LRFGFSASSSSPPAPSSFSSSSFFSPSSFERRQVVVLLLGGLGGRLVVGVDAVGHEVEDGAQLAERVHRLALDEVGVLLLADLVLDLVDGQLALEVEEVVQHLDPAARQVVEEVGVRPVLLVEDVRQHEELLLGVEDRLLDPLEPHLARAEVLLDPEGDEGGLEEVLLEAVVAQRIHEIHQVGHLAGVHDAEPVHVPAHRVARLGHPPIVVIAEADNTPV
jgi:hypothetical protein